MTPDETLAEVAKHVAVLRNSKAEFRFGRGCPDQAAICSLIALVPEPVPEWPDEVVAAWLEANQSIPIACRCTGLGRGYAIAHLTAMRKAGIDITLRET